MSYNIDRWKVKKLRNLRIPLTSFFKHERKDWHPKKKLEEDGSLTLDGCFEEIVIHGTVEGGVLCVDRLKCVGEGSGTFCHWILDPALADSTGLLEVVRIWEGGDSIDRLTVKDGVLTNEEIDL